MEQELRRDVVVLRIPQTARNTRETVGFSTGTVINNRRRGKHAAANGANVNAAYVTRDAIA